MKMKEAEQKTGLSKQTLIWYEKEGLIHPRRNENQYREYSDHDIMTLRLIRMLRNMDVSIDDIRQFLENHLSLEELLEEQKAFLRGEADRVRDMENTVRFYADTQAPMIEDLEKMHQPKTDWAGRQKPLKTFRIGARPDRKVLKKLLLWNLVWSVGVLFVAVLFLYNFETVWEKPLPVLFLPLVAGAAVLLGMFGFGIPQMGAINIADRYCQYAEFSRDGMSYIRANSLAEKLRFLSKAMKGRENEYMTFVPYEKIENVTICRDTKYAKVFVPIAGEFSVTSFVFRFKDKASYSILHRFFYDNDEEIIIRILKEYVDQVQICDRRVNKK